MFRKYPSSSPEFRRSRWQQFQVYRQVADLETCTAEIFENPLLLFCTEKAEISMQFVQQYIWRNFHLLRPNLLSDQWGSKQVKGMLLLVFRCWTNGRLSE